MPQKYVHNVDGGPIYFESDFNAFIAEPWNMVSAAAFIVLAIYWILRTKGHIGKQPFVFGASIMLLIGAVGGTVYHGFRESALMLYMDWVPIMLICISAAIYFLKISLGSWWNALIVLGSVGILEYFNWTYAPINYANNISYIIMATAVLLSTYLVLKKYNFKNYHYIIFALGAFALAITCRMVDRYGILSMGTHFLWHAFGAVATHYMFLYVSKLELKISSPLKFA